MGQRRNLKSARNRKFWRIFSKICRKNPGKSSLNTPLEVLWLSGDFSLLILNLHVQLRSIQLPFFPARVFS